MDAHTFVLAFLIGFGCGGRSQSKSAREKKKFEQWPISSPGLVQV